MMHKNIDSSLLKGSLQKPFSFLFQVTALVLNRYIKKEIYWISNLSGCRNPFVNI